MSDVFRHPLTFRAWRRDPNSIAAQSQNEFIQQSFPPFIPAAAVQAPFFQTDWPVPRGALNEIAWLQRGHRTYVEEVPSEPRSPVFWRREPLDASRAQTQPLGSNIAVLSTPAAQPMPCNQYNWPNPRGPQPVPQDFHASFPLPLQEVIQPNQYNWPNPRGPEPLNRGWTDYILPWAQAPPLRQNDWPVPPGPRRNPQDWKSSFPLPLQQTLPLNQYSWPNPPLAAKRNPQDWIYTILPNRTPTGAPFFQTDWPNPRGPLRGTPDWKDSFKLPLQQTLPFNEYDWPNPVLPIARRPDWEDWFKLPLQQTLPPRQTDWPNPRGPLRGNPDWISPSNIALFTAVAPPFKQTEWPNPVLPIARRPDWEDWFKLPLQQTLPPRQLDWPNPVLRIVQRPDWLDFFPLPLQQNQPLNQHDWPNPVTPLARRPDWILPQPYVLNAVQVQTNPGYNEWGVPWGPQRRLDWILPQPYTLNIVVGTPIVPIDWPVPRGPRRNPQDWTDSFKLPLQQTLPENQYSWPNPPLAARRNPQDWIQSVPRALASTIPPPIAQYDWPVPKGPAPRQAWTDRFKLPLQQTLPENQYNWPNPVLARKPVVADWILPIPATLTFVQAPLNQHDWPNPSLRKGSLLPTWIDRFKLPLQQVLPPRQLDWPVPKGRRHAGEAINFTLLTPPAPPIPPAGPTLTLKNERIRLRFLENQSAQSGRVRFLKNEIRR